MGAMSSIPQGDGTSIVKTSWSYWKPTPAGRKPLTVKYYQHCSQDEAKAEANKFAEFLEHHHGANLLSHRIWDDGERVNIEYRVRDR